MWKKIKDSKWLYVVLSLLMASVLWIYVVKEANPTEKRSITNIPITFTGTEILAARNLIISDGANQTMTLNLEAKSDVFSKLNRENITLSVDVSQISEPGTYRLLVKPSYPINVNQLDVTVNNDVSELYVEFSVSELESKEIPVRLEFKGSYADDYMAGKPTITPGTINISGQQELVNQVAYAKVVLTIEDMSESYEGDLPFVYVSADGTELTDLDVTANVDTVHVEYPIVKTKQIPVTVDIIPGGGATASDVDVTYGVNNETVMYLTISGPEDQLEAYDKIVLGEIDLSKVYTQETFTFPVVLNENFTNESGISSVDVTVTIDDTRLTTREFTVDNIQMINKPEGYNAELVTESRLVTVRGPEDAVNALYQSQLRIVVDLSQAQLATGRQTVQAQVIIDGSSDVGVLGGEYDVLVNFTLAE